MLLFVVPLSGIALVRQRRRRRAAAARRARTSPSSWRWPRTSGWCSSTSWWTGIDCWRGCCRASGRAGRRPRQGAVAVVEPGGGVRRQPDRALVELGRRPLIASWSPGVCSPSQCSTSADDLALVAGDVVGAQQRPRPGACGRPAARPGRGGPRPRSARRRAGGERAADVEEVAQPRVDPVLVGSARPRHPRPVHPAVVGGVRGVVGPARVVEQAELVAHPEHRHAAEAEDDRVRQQDARRSASGSPASSPASDASEPEMRRSPVTGVLLEDQAAGPRRRGTSRSTSRTGTAGAANGSSPTAAASSSAIAQPMSSWQRT